jgi:hypothetical protein
MFMAYSMASLSLIAPAGTWTIMGAKVACGVVEVT